MNVGFVTMSVVMESVVVSSLVELVAHIARFTFHLITSYVHHTLHCCFHNTLCLKDVNSLCRARVFLSLLRMKTTSTLWSSRKKAKAVGDDDTSRFVTLSCLVLLTCLQL